MERVTKKRADIQGLRAIAVAAVVLYHLRPQWFPGGFVGVDVFFVISGFLITGSIVSETARTGSVKIIQFWGRRIRRLMPAATVVIVATIVAAALLLPRSEWITIATQAIASATSAENWVLAANSVNYLQATTLPSPFQHFWSLSVEEQFYVLWPLAIIAATFIALRLSRRTESTLRIVVLILTLVAFVYSLYLSFSQPQIAYFSTFGRAWELLLGASTALWLPVIRLPRPAATALFVAGPIAIAASIWLFSGGTPFPGYAALLPTLGAAAVITGGATAGPSLLRRAFELRPVVYLGDISYSLYLWHWPIIVIVGATLGVLALPIWAATIVVVVSIGIAALSKRFVEDVFRKPPRRDQRLTARRFDRLRSHPFTFAAALIGITSLTAGLLYEDLVHINSQESQFAQSHYPGGEVLEPGFNPRAVTTGDVPPRPTLLTLANVERELRYPCLQSASATKVSTCKGGDPHGSRTILIAGDSHAAEWLPALDDLGKKYHWRIIVAAKQSCTLVTTQGRYTAGDPVYPECAQWNTKLRTYIRALHPDLVFTSAAFYSYSKGVNQGSEAFDAMMGRAYDRQYSFIEDLGIPVVAVEETPQFTGFSPPDCLSKLNATARGCSAQMTAALDPLASRIAQAAKVDPRLKVINVNHLICSASKCSSVIGNVVTYRDDNHLTAPFVKSLSWFIRAQLGKVDPSLFP